MTTAQGRPRRMWLDDIKQWTHLNTMKTSKDWLKIEHNVEFALRHINLLIEKTTADDELNVWSEIINHHHHAEVTAWRLWCLMCKAVQWGIVHAVVQPRGGLGGASPLKASSTTFFVLIIFTLCWDTD